jgi:hypothetical protein
MAHFHCFTLNIQKVMPRKTPPVLVDVTYPKSGRTYTFSNVVRAAERLNVHVNTVRGALAWGKTLKAGHLKGYTVSKSKHKTTETVVAAIKFGAVQSKLDRKAWLCSVYNDLTKEYARRGHPIPMKVQEVLGGILDGTIRTKEEVVTRIPGPPVKKVS